MRTIVNGIMVTATGIGLLAGVAPADHNEPFKAKAVKVNLVTAYEPCTSPNTMTDDNIQACAPPVRSDPLCSFSGGQGSVQIKTIDQRGFQIKLKVKGLEEACDGATLTFLASARNTSHNCAGIPCTAVDQPSVSLGTCTVQRGVCIVFGVLIFPGGAERGGVEMNNIILKRGTLTTARSGAGSHPL